MAFLGKEYKFVKEENFEDFVNSLGLSPEQVKGYSNYRPSQKFTLNGDTYTVTTTTAEGTKELSFKSGVAFDETVVGLNSKTTFTVDGNTITQVQKYSDGHDLTIVRQFSGDELVVTLTTSKWSGSACRYYKA